MTARNYVRSAGTGSAGARRDDVRTDIVLPGNAGLRAWPAHVRVSCHDVEQDQTWCRTWDTSAVV